MEKEFGKELPPLSANISQTPLSLSTISYIPSLHISSFFEVHNNKIFDYSLLHEASLNKANFS